MKYKNIWDDSNINNTIVHMRRRYKDAREVIINLTPDERKTLAENMEPFRREIYLKRILPVCLGQSDVESLEKIGKRFGVTKVAVHYMETEILRRILRNIYRRHAI